MARNRRSLGPANFGPEPPDWFGGGISWPAFCHVVAVLELTYNQAMHAYHVVLSRTAKETAHCMDCTVVAVDKARGVLRQILKVSRTRKVAERVLGAMDDFLDDLPGGAQPEA